MLEQAAGAHLADTLAIDAGGFRVSTKTFRSRRHLPTHCYTGATLCVVLSGSLREVDRSRRWSFSASDVFYRPAGEAHTNDIGCSDARVVTLELGPRRLRQLAGTGLRVDRPLRRRSSLAAVAAARIQAEIRSAERPSRLIVEGLALELLSVALEEGSQESKPAPDWLRDLRERLLTEPEREHSLSQLAGSVGVSPASLARAFRAHFGTSLGQYALRARVDKAARLLLRSDEPLASVALACGFFDQSHLSRSFKRTTGLTPGRFRRIAGGR